MSVNKSRIICLITSFILLLSVLPLVNNQMTATGDVSEYQQVINSLYELGDNQLLPETVGERYTDQYGYNSLPITQNQPGNEGYRVQQSITSESFSQLVVTLDISHEPGPHMQYSLLEEALISEGATFNIMEEFIDIPPDTNVLLVSSPNASYSFDEITMISDWFYSEGPHLIWIAGDSDFRGLYSPEPNNGILEMLGSNLRFSADAVDDEVCNDSMSFRVAVQTPVKDGDLNMIFTEGVGSAIFHGPTSVLGFQDGIIDLRWDGIEGVEVIMQSSVYATAMDLDDSFTDFDYYSTPIIDTGSYPMIAIQNMSGSKYVIASGEVIYSDYKSQYSYVTETGGWNEGVHEGKLLVDNILAWFGYVVESEVPQPPQPPQPESQLRVAFDVSHVPTVHYNAFMLEEALSSIDVEFRYLWDIRELSDDIDVLLISSSTLDYNVSELDRISNWFDCPGDKLLWIAGDSDFRGFYSPKPNNGILEILGSKLRLSADAVDDKVNNDNASYRVAVPTPVSDGGYNSIFTDGVSSAIFHGPTSVLGYQAGAVLDLRVSQPEGVEIIMQTSKDAQAVNLFGDYTDFDFYSKDEQTGGNYPMMAIDSHFENGKYVIVSGEPIFTDYKNMYGVHTEQGLIGNPHAWNGGVHDGKILVDNVFNWFGLDPALPRYYGHAPIYIESDEDFKIPTNNFTGSGKMEDPYSLEGFSFASTDDNLITISGTSAYFHIGDNLFEGSNSGFSAIQLFDVGNGIISSNIIRNNHIGIDVNNIYDCTIANNRIFDNEHDAIRMHYSERITFDNNIIYNTGASGFSIATSTNINVMNNILFNNQFGMHTAGFDNSFITGNVFYGNFEEGMRLWHCVNNEIFGNRFYFQGYTSIGLYYSDDNTFSDNIVRGSSFGVLLETSQNNHIVNNEIFETETGISLNNKAGNNRVRENILYANNQGIFISNEPYSVVDLWPKQHIFATDSDRINWRAIWFETYSELPIDKVHDGLLQVKLTINGFPVDTSFSEVYFDGEQWCFDITYLSDLLSVGEYEFAAQFIFEGEIKGEPIAHVTIMPTPPVRNFIILNTLYDNNNGILLQNANDNIVAGNVLTNNFGEGIGVYGSCNNFIGGNQIEFSGMKGIMVAHDFGWDITSEFNTILNNIINGGNEDGISLEWSNNNLVENNEIFDNQWAGVRLFGTSRYNDIIANTIHDNRGGGIAFESYSDIAMPFWQDITATEADYISWFSTFGYEDIEQAWNEHDNLETILTIDGQIVGVEYSEVYWDDWTQPFTQYPWKFTINYYSNPLPIGEHVFTVKCTLEGEIIREKTAFVTVIPAAEEDYVSYNYISENKIFRNEWSGIDLRKTYGNQLTENQIYQHYGEGIHIEDSEDNIIDSNTIFENDVGIGVFSADNNILSNNDIFWNNWNGIHISGTSSHNTVADNMIHQNSGGGINIDSYSDVFMRFWQNIIANEANHISWQASFVKLDLGELESIYYHLVTELTIDDELVEVWDSGIYEDGRGQWRFDINYYSDPLPEGDHVFHTQFILAEVPQEQWTRTAIVTVIPATDEDYVSNNNIVNNNIFENGWNGINIWRAHSNLVDMNRISNNAGHGIWIGESRSNEILNNLVEFSGADSGINLYHSYNHIVSGNTITNGFFGIFLDESNGNTLIDNYISDNDGPGIQLVGTSSDNAIIGNTIHRDGCGILINSYSVPATAENYASHNTIISNDIYECTWIGIGLWDSHYNYIKENVISAGTAGIRLDNSKFNTITENDASGCENGGVMLLFSSDHNVATGNRLHGHGKSGIFVWFSSFNEISNNILFENGMDGIASRDSNSNEYRSNTVFANPIGIGLYSSSDSIITRNFLFNNAEAGIYLVDDSSGNSITKNRVFNCGKAGISVLGGSINYIIRNNIKGSYFGIFLESTSFNYVYWNRVKCCYFGIALESSTNNYISRNFVFRNVEGILLSCSSNNCISRNFVFRNKIGIHLVESSDNKLYRNWVFCNDINILEEQ